MIGAHVILHLGLCNAMLKMPPGSSTTVHVHMVDRLNRPHVDQDFTLKRYADSTAPIEFDAPPGLFQIAISVPQYRCSAQDFVFFIDQHNRTIAEQLVDGIGSAGQPVLLDGIASSSFIYLQPSFVLFDKSTECNKPVPDPLPAHITIEDDQDSFYVWMYSDPTLVARGPEIVALQLQTPTGDEHYIRIKVPFPAPWEGMPEEIQFNVRDDDVDWLSGQPTGVLLCPRIFRTSAG
ncbi:MAG TPA: hypothetical protein VMG98_14840 [Verrucomicrobiae bacterium]|nr:hypothetical protein [Verrucomicrobiae bacterium]